MENDHESYVSPLATRYASKEMSSLFGEQHKFETFRKLWIILAESEKECGLAISDEQIAELKAHARDINYDVASKKEAEIRHDVMAQIYAYGVQCPKAKGIIHLGATSCYVDDNTDILILRDASNLLLAKASQVLFNLKGFALKYKGLPTLGYTHLQPAQLTTVGKRACLWMNELCMDMANLSYQLSVLKPRGIKGATGTQASFLDLFNGDKAKVKKLDRLVTKAMGFTSSVPVSGQTYSRKTDAYLLDCLAGFASTLYKFSDDLRLLQSFQEIEEPFEKAQVGSSAMPYKRNPMRAERMSGLARYVMVESLNPLLTSASQFFERTLDDSANRRLSLSESFLATDALLNLAINITDGLVVNRKVIAKRVADNLPFMASENILMEAVKKGKDRQEIHEILREYAQQSGDEVKQGLPNTFLDKVLADKRIGLTSKELAVILDPIRFTGLASDQTTEFIQTVVNPLLKKYHKQNLHEELSL
jgi:adenylosuccinate lyase